MDADILQSYTPKGKTFAVIMLGVSWHTTWSYSYGHLLVITGYKWDYTFYKLGYKYL